MERYKSRCAKCGANYSWSGYKTGIGKTPERRESECAKCGADGLETALDGLPWPSERKKTSAVDCMKTVIIAISGPSKSGKSRIAFLLAEALHKAGVDGEVTADAALQYPLSDLSGKTRVLIKEEHGENEMTKYTYKDGDS